MEEGYAPKIKMGTRAYRERERREMERMKMAMREVVVESEMEAGRMSIGEGGGDGVVVRVKRVVERVVE